MSGDIRIRDATGKSYGAGVNKSGQLLTRSVTESSQQDAAEGGYAYNFNTGILALTDETESAVMYLKNTGTHDLVVTAIAVGVGALSGTVSDPVQITIVRAPTSGTVVSDAVDVDINSNRNFASPRTFVGDVYKGGQGKTLTDGSDSLIFFTNANSRLFSEIGIAIPQGATIGVKIKLNATGGGNVYAALVGYEDNAA